MNSPLHNPVQPQTGRRVLHAGIAFCGIAIAVLAFAPASWLAGGLERQSQGRLTLAATEGSVWRGSAILAARQPGSESSTPLLPGRFEWQLSPLLLIGRLDLHLRHADALPRPLHLHGSWLQVTLEPGALRLPADGLVAFGAPFNTLAPHGRLQLRWTQLQLQTASPGVNGHATLDLDDMRSRLSPVAPLGSYRLGMAWHERSADLTLSTLRGPLLLDGKGSVQDGRLQFTGHADAEDAHKPALANLLNLLGQPRQLNGRNLIAFEFK